MTTSTLSQELAGLLDCGFSSASVPQEENKQESRRSGSPRCQWNLEKYFCKVKVLLAFILSSKDRLTVVFVLNQEVSYGAIQRVVPFTAGVNLDILKLRRLRVCSREDFCSSDGDGVDCCSSHQLLSHLDSCPFTNWWEGFDPLGIAGPPIHS